MWEGLSREEAIKRIAEEEGIRSREAEKKDSAKNAESKTLTDSLSHSKALEGNDALS